MLIAVDIALLPAERDMPLFLEWNARLLAEGDDTVRLAADERAGYGLPHVSLSMGVLDEERAPALADALEGKGLAYLHVIETAGAATVTRQLRERFSGTIILNQGYDRSSAEEALQEGLGDLVSFGRAFLANPDLPRRLELDADLNEPDPDTFYGGTEVGYTSYPKLG